MNCCRFEVGWVYVEVDGRSRLSNQDSEAMHRGAAASPPARLSIFCNSYKFSKEEPSYARICAY